MLEVTEGVLMESTDRNRHILETVRGLGFVALDDFGTGFSSLRYLCDFRFTRSRSTAPSSPASTNASGR